MRALAIGDAGHLADHVYAGLLRQAEGLHVLVVFLAPHPAADVDESRLQELPTASMSVWWRAGPARLEQWMVQMPTFTEPVQLNVLFRFTSPSSMAMARVMGL